MNSISYFYQAILTPGCILLPVFLAIFNYKYLGNALKILLVYLLASGGLNLFAIMHSHHNNLPLLHIYTVLEFLTLTFYFIKIGLKETALRFSYLLMLIFPVLCLLNVLFFQSKYQYNSYVRPLEGILLIGFCLNYFSESTEWGVLKLENFKVYNWINAGILIYFCGALFLFIFSNFFTRYLSQNSSMLLLDLHDTLVVIMYILFTVGINKCKPQKIVSLS